MDNDSKTPRPSDDDRISALVDGELTSAEQADVERLVEEDSESAAVLEGINQVHAAMQSLPHEVVEGDFTSRVMAGIAEAKVAAAEAKQAKEKEVAGAAKFRLGNEANGPVISSTVGTGSLANRQVWRRYVGYLVAIAAAALFIFTSPALSPFGRDRDRGVADVDRQSQPPELQDDGGEQERSAAVAATAETQNESLFDETDSAVQPPSDSPRRLLKTTSNQNGSSSDFYATPDLPNKGQADLEKLKESPGQVKLRSSLQKRPESFDFETDESLSAPADPIAPATAPVDGLDIAKPKLAFGDESKRRGGRARVNQNDENPAIDPAEKVLSELEEGPGSVELDFLRDGDGDALSASDIAGASGATKRDDESPEPAQSKAAVAPLNAIAGSNVGKKPKSWADVPIDEAAPFGSAGEKFSDESVDLDSDGALGEDHLDRLERLGDANRGLGGGGFGGGGRGYENGSNAAPSALSLAVPSNDDPHAPFLNSELAELTTDRLAVLTLPAESHFLSFQEKAKNFGIRIQDAPVRTLNRKLSETEVVVPPENVSEAKAVVFSVQNANTESNSAGAVATINRYAMEGKLDEKAANDFDDNAALSDRVFSLRGKQLGLSAKSKASGSPVRGRYVLVEAPPEVMVKFASSLKPNPDHLVYGRNEGQTWEFEEADAMADDVAEVQNEAKVEAQPSRAYGGAFYDGGVISGGGVVGGALPEGIGIAAGNEASPKDEFGNQPGQQPIENRANGLANGRGREKAGSDPASQKLVRIVFFVPDAQPVVGSVVTGGMESAGEEVVGEAVEAAPSLEGSIEIQPAVEAIPDVAPPPPPVLNPTIDP